MASCEDCPLRGSTTPCLGAMVPRFAHFCDRAREGESHWLRMIADRSAVGYAPPPPPPSSPSPPTSIPLAGDVVEVMAKRIGADRLARWWEEKTGIPCGCEERKEKLNRATRALLRWAGLG